MGSTLNQVIEDFDHGLSQLREIGEAGFVVAFNMSIHGPEYMHSEFPKEWQAIYEERSFAVGDPVLMWAMAYQGTRRWSEIKLPDMRNVMASAQAFGLRFGAVLSTKHDRKRSFMSLARSDREISDIELELAETIFGTWSAAVVGSASGSAC